MKVITSILERVGWKREFRTGGRPFLYIKTSKTGASLVFKRELTNTLEEVQLPLDSEFVITGVQVERIPQGYIDRAVKEDPSC
jgi:hypothetical protein